MDAVMPLYNLTESTDDYLKISGSLWRYYRDEPDLNSDSNIAIFPGDSSTIIIIE